jgi:hypothetical protein
MKKRKKLTYEQEMADTLRREHGLPPVDRETVRINPIIMWGAGILVGLGIAYFIFH